MHSARDHQQRRPNVSWSCLRHAERGGRGEQPRKEQISEHEKNRQNQNSTIEIETALTILRNATVDIASCYATFLFRVATKYANDDIGNDKQECENTGENDKTRTLVLALVVNETCGVSHQNPRSEEQQK